MDDAGRAVGAAMAVAAGQGLDVDAAVVLSESNAMAVLLRPCDAVARVAHRGSSSADQEVALATALVAAGGPVGPLDPRVEPRPHERDGFVVTLWTYLDPVPGPHAAAAYAAALHGLHRAMRTIDVVAPHYTDRVAEALAIVADPERSPALTADDRALLVATLRDRPRAIAAHGVPEQLVHGEPHPGNVITTADGLRFIDLETCVVGPVELDVAHVPTAVGRLYPDADAEVLDHMRCLVLAIVAAWRWDPSDQLPDGRRAGRDLVAALRHGPPWPTLDELMP